MKNAQAVRNTSMEEGGTDWVDARLTELIDNLHREHINLYHLSGHSSLPKWLSTELGRISDELSGLYQILSEAAICIEPKTFDTVFAWIVKGRRELHSKIETPL
jgi:hypothetical protein